MWLDVLNFFFVEFDFKGAAARNDDDALRVFGGLVEEEAKRFVKKGHDVQRLRRLKEDVDAAMGADAESLTLSKP